MRDAPSRTAEAVCFMRASDQRRDADRRIVDDPYAKLFLGALWRAALAGLGAAGRLGERTEAELSTGVTTFILARHRFMDDALRAALAAGVDQVLILGAGYDTRIWRFAEAIGRTPVFEVDHPATSERKAALAAEAKADLPLANPVRLQVDFRTDALDERLLFAGFTKGARTFVVWEGVSMYLTRAAVKETLGLLRDLCGPGSALVMDWWFMVDAPDAVSTVLRMTPQMLHLLGEPVTLGIHPEDVPGFCERLGWRCAELAESVALEERYVPDHRRIMPAMYVTRLERAAGP
jgi:methyltransferase (TIGR00027 family)